MSRRRETSPAIASSSGKKLVVPREAECGYCLENIGDATRPKVLPCGHVFCEPCLLEDYAKKRLSGVLCPLCR